MIKKIALCALSLLLSATSLTLATEEDLVVDYIMKRRTEALQNKEEMSGFRKKTGDALRGFGDVLRGSDAKAKDLQSVLVVCTETILKKGEEKKEVKSNTLYDALGIVWSCTGKYAASWAGAGFRTMGGKINGGSTRVSTLLADYWLNETEVKKKPQDVIMFSVSSLLSIYDDQIVALQNIPDIIIDMVQRIVKRGHTEYNDIMPDLFANILRGVSRYHVYTALSEENPEGIALGPISKEFIKIKRTEIRKTITLFDLFSAGSEKKDSKDSVIIGDLLEKFKDKIEMYQQERKKPTEEKEPVEDKGSSSTEEKEPVEDKGSSSIEEKEPVEDKGSSSTDSPKKEEVSEEKKPEEGKKVVVEQRKVVLDDEKKPIDGSKVVGEKEKVAKQFDDLLEYFISFFYDQASMSLEHKLRGAKLGKIPQKKEKGVFEDTEKPSEKSHVKTKVIVEVKTDVPVKKDDSIIVKDQEKGSSDKKEEKKPEDEK